MGQFVERLLLEPFGLKLDLGVPLQLQSVLWYDFRDPKNGKTALHTLERTRDAKALHRIIVGNDAPSGTGVVPLGILRVIAHLFDLEDAKGAIETSGAG